MIPRLLRRSLVQFTETLLPRDFCENLRDRVQRRRRERDAARLVWWDAQNRNKGGPVVQLQHGVRMRLCFGGELSRLIFQGEFEMEERRFLNAFLRPGDVFVDIGANLGLFTLIAARLVGKRGVVHAFEPCSATCRLLRENVSLNGFQNVAVHELALSDDSGSRELITAAHGLDAWNSFARPYVGEQFEKERVTTRTWDELVAEHGLAARVALMKIDVEGWEAPVLEGARQSLRQRDAPVLQVEFTDEAATAAGYSCRGVYQQLEELGYKLYFFDAGQRTLVPDPIRDRYPYLNLFAVKDVDAAMRRLRGERL